MISKLLKPKLFSISKDFGLNLFASIIATGVAQLILYPLLLRYMTSDGYGEMLTIMGIANTIAVSCGGSLNNARLLLQPKYEKDSLIGDFPVVLLSMVSISTVFFIILLNIHYCQNYISIIWISIFTALCLLRSYWCVEYRIILNYKRVLLSNVCVAIGNLLGLIIFVIFKNEGLWPFPFALGELAAFVYIYFTTNIVREPIRITSLFTSMISKEAILLLSFLSSNLLTYLDRLLLLPLLGGTAVSYYTVASVFGKSIGIVMMPLAGVLLSYYAQKGFNMSKSLFWKINIATLIIGFIFSLISIAVSPLFVEVMYASVFDKVKIYLIIANITAIINIIGNMTQPSVLKFAPTFWQLIIQAVYCFIYLFGGIYAVGEMGLWGFAVVALISSIVKVLMLYLVGHLFIGNLE